PHGRGDGLRNDDDGVRARAREPRAEASRDEARAAQSSLSHAEHRRAASSDADVRAPAPRVHSRRDQRRARAARVRSQRVRQRGSRNDAVIFAHRHEHEDAEFMPALLDLGWDAEDRDDTWLVSFADLISTTLAMVVLLFGRSALTTPALDVPAPA